MGTLHDVFPNLQYLEIDAIDANSYSDENLYTQLPLLKSLKSLHVIPDYISSDWQLNFTNLWNIGQCLSLECLSIRLPLFEEVDVSHLSTLVNLRSLDLRNSQSLYTEGLELVLAELTELRELKIPCLREHYEHNEESALKSSMITSLTLGFCRCRGLPDPRFLPALRALHVQHLTLEWDGRNGVSERSACAALQRMCHVTSFSCDTLSISEKTRFDGVVSSCSGLLQALADCCTSPRCLPSVTHLDFLLNEIFPCELVRLTQLLPCEKARIQYRDYDLCLECSPLRCTLVEAVQIFSSVSEILICPPTLEVEGALLFAKFTGTVFDVCATARNQKRSKDLLIRLKPDSLQYDCATYTSFKSLAKAWRNFATGMGCKDGQQDLPTKVDLQVANTDF